ncbi:MAG: hypothetical protein SGPRY_003176 [Prymnesium sp.]
MVPTLIFQPDLPHTAPPTPCNHSCRAHWAEEARRILALTRKMEARETTFTLGETGAEEIVSTRLFGYNLELTRHGMFAGLSAQLVANRLFTSPDGAWPPPRWERAGEQSPRLEAPGISGTETTFAVRCSVGGGHASACGVRQRQVLDGFDAGLGSGSSIALVAGKEYAARVALRTSVETSERALEMSFMMSEDDGSGDQIFSYRWLEQTGGQAWHAHSFNFTSPVTTRSAILSLVGHHAGKRKLLVRFWIGAISLMPADNFHGARTDVIHSLRRIGFRGPVRWPGGCYSSVAAPWQQGLLPPDRRPPVKAPPATHFCNAVPGGLLAHTDGYAEHWPSIDEYMKIIRVLRAEPAVGMQVQFGSDEEVASGREFVEYCNGGLSTPMGRLRASRGHPEPFGIQIWYLGNEMGVQGRYPPSGKPGEWANPVAAATAEEYRDILGRVIPALLAVDSSLKLVAANAAPNVSVRFASQERLAAGWNAPYLEQFGSSIWANSHHHYMRQPAMWDPISMTITAKRSHSHAISSLRQFRRHLDSASPHGSYISFDEWALGPPWSTKQFGSPHALYGASLLIQLIRNAASLKLRSANYYEPINEGAIKVGPWNCSLTPLGEAFELLSRHQGNFLLVRTDGERHVDDDDLEMLASSDGRIRGMEPALY